MTKSLLIKASRKFSEGEEAAASNKVVMGVFHWPVC